MTLTFLRWTLLIPNKCQRKHSKPTRMTPAILKDPPPTRSQWPKLPVSKNMCSNFLSLYVQILVHLLPKRDNKNLILSKIIKMTCTVRKLFPNMHRKWRRLKTHKYFKNLMKLNSKRMYPMNSRMRLFSLTAWSKNQPELVMSAFIKICCVKSENISTKNMITFQRKYWTQLIVNITIQESRTPCSLIY